MTRIPAKKPRTKASRAVVWSTADAKARFSDLVDQAIHEGPQTITRHGRKVAVVVAAEEWERRQKPKDSLADFLARSPLRGSGIRIRRLKGGMRPVDL